MKNQLVFFLLITGLLLGACSTTSSPGTRTLSPDRELAEPSQLDSAAVDTAASLK